MTTKIHVAVDGLGNPVRLIITAGQSSEFGQANALISGFYADYILVDKGYDSDSFIKQIHWQGAEPVIPSRSHRKQKRNHDKILYKERNLVERFFQKMKNFRRVATRYDKLARNYLGMLYLSASLIWLT